MANEYPEPTPDVAHGEHVPVETVDPDEFFQEGITQLVHRLLVTQLDFCFLRPPLSLPSSPPLSLS